jgi:hypothetical protein
MKLLKYLFACILIVFFLIKAKAETPVHVWEMQELSFTANTSYPNPYTDVKIWVELSGPGFNKKVYGFWDGGNTFRVRVVATKAGLWRWKSGSNTNDAGLNNKAGSFTAIEWSEQKKNENPLRRGFIQSSANHHALIYADSTPYFAIGDTWYSLASNRFKWYDDNKERPIGPNAGFKDYVRFRKSQGFNWVNMIAAFPNWKTDNKPWLFMMPDSTTVIRTAWMDFNSGSAKNMNNDGGLPFLYPGKVPGYENYFPDMDRINPDYFKVLDKKIAYLNANGFVPFIEAFRRDASVLWSKYYDWPGSYIRYVQYIYSRYQAYNTILSPVHLDIIDLTISPDEYSAALKKRENEFGTLPFGNLQSANANPSTLENWGDSSWITLNQIGGGREHFAYWYLTEIFNLKNPTPALNGEGYYAGFSDPRGKGAVNYSRGAKGGTEKDNMFIRSNSYGSFLSGGLAGHVYGAEGIWGGDIESKAPTKMWDAFQWKSAAEMHYLRTFAFSIGKRYQDLVPIADLVIPNRNYELQSFEGWVYCARTDDKNIFLVYFENGCPQVQLRGARLNSVYDAQWFNPRDGSWINAGDGVLVSGKTGIIKLPPMPGSSDWGLKLIYKAPRDSNVNYKEWENTSQSRFRRETIFPLIVVAGGILIILTIAILLYRKKRLTKKNVKQDEQIPVSSVE